MSYDANSVLLGYQKRWIDDDSTLKIGEKSRRTGLTWAEAADACLYTAKSKSAGGGDHFYVGSTKEMAREFIDAVAMWAKAFNKAAGEIQEEIIKDEDKKILVYVVNFDSGFKVKALSSNPSNLRGMQGNVTIDEAAFHDRLAEVLKAALALTMWGSKVRIISTHNGIDNLFNQLIIDSRAGRKRYSIHTITLDDACADGLYKRICQVKGIEWSQQQENQWKEDLLSDTATREDALEEYYCVPKNGDSVYLPRTLIERAYAPIPVLSFETPEGWLEWSTEQREKEVALWCKERLDIHLNALDTNLSHCFGCDFARKGDLSVFAVGALENSTQLNTQFMLELRNVNYEQQLQFAMHVISHIPKLRGAGFDATGNGGYLAEAVAIRIGTTMVEQVDLNDRWYREWMPKLKARFEDGMITVPRNQDVADDLRKIVVKNGVPKIEKGSGKGSDGKQRHGDAAVALAMMVRASHMDGAPIEFTPLPNDNRWDERNDDDDHYSEMRGLY